jgi:hypothetical protein
VGDNVMTALSKITDETSADHVIVRPRGGLGNQIFQLSAGYFVAEQLGAELTLQVDAFERRRLNLSFVDQPRRKFELTTLFTKLPRVDLNSARSPFENLSIRLARAGKLRLSQNAAKMQKRSIAVEFKNQFTLMMKASSELIIDGYWQSSELVRAVEPTMRELFSSIDPKIKTDAETLLGKYSDRDIVAVHVRRGDYTSGKFDTATLPLQYYAKALEHFPNHYPLIFSDDVEWCKQNLQISGAEFWTDENPFTSMVAMSLCSGSIIANSTFSWWSAWFGSRHKSLIVGPSGWYKKTSPYQMANKHILDRQWLGL